jgi:hypothetical protein
MESLWQPIQIHWNKGRCYPRRRFWKTCFWKTTRLIPVNEAFRFLISQAKKLPSVETTLHEFFTMALTLSNVSFSNNTYNYSLLKEFLTEHLLQWGKWLMPLHILLVVQLQSPTIP